MAAPATSLSVIIPAPVTHAEPPYLGGYGRIGPLLPGRAVKARTPGLNDDHLVHDGKVQSDFPILGVWKLWIAFTGCQATPVTAGQRLTVKVQGQMHTQRRA
jgi:hypothetical protein